MLRELLLYITPEKLKHVIQIIIKDNANSFIKRFGHPLDHKCKNWIIGVSVGFSCSIIATDTQLKVLVKLIEEGYIQLFLVQYFEF